MIGSTMNPRQFLDRVAQELARIDPAEVQKLSELIHERYAAGRFVFVIGNGGSGSNASHLCEDLGKGTLRREDFDNDAKKRLKILSLTDNSPYILAWGNDNMSLYLNNQAGSLRPPAYYFTHYLQGPFAVADFNKDGSPDVAFGNAYGLLTIMLNQGPSAF